jgi:uncharacterized protein (DUF1800 family)
VILDDRGRALLDPVVIAAGIPQEVVESARDAATEAVNRLERRRLDDDRPGRDVVAVGRELQELFTMGINDVVTGAANYTEEDVKAKARVG